MTTRIVLFVLVVLSVLLPPAPAAAQSVFETRPIAPAPVARERFTFVPLGDDEPIAVGGGWYWDNSPPLQTVTTEHLLTITMFPTNILTEAGTNATVFAATTNAATTAVTNSTPDDVSCPALYANFPLIRFKQFMAGVCLVVPLEAIDRTRPGVDLSFTLPGGNFAGVTWANIQLEAAVLFSERKAYFVGIGTTF